MGVKAKRALGLGVASGVLAITMVAGGGLAASAATGACSYITSDTGGTIVATCKGTFKIGWTCWSDLFGHWNYKTFKLGSPGMSFRFKACNSGNVHYITVS